MLSSIFFQCELERKRPHFFGDDFLLQLKFNQESSGNRQAEKYLGSQTN